MRGGVVMMAGLLLAGTAGPGAAAPPPAPLTATAAGPWQVDYGDTQCLAVRKFRAGTQAFTFLIAPDPTGRGAQIAMKFDRPLPRVSPGYRGAKLTLDGRPLQDGLEIKPTSDGGLIVIGGYALLEDEAALSLAASRAFTVDSSFLRLTVPLDAIAKAMPILQDCGTGLLALWGFSKADQARLGQPAKGYVPRYFRSSDYPDASIRANRQGQVTASYRIGTDGKARDCVVRISSGDPNLDRQTCMVINQRVRYRPALDKAGQPMTMVDSARVRWIFPEG